MDDLQVFHGLGHHALVGRHHQQHGVEALDPGQQVADEARVPGDVDDAHLPAAGQLQVGEAEVDRHAPSLLLGEPVGVDPGQRLDERGLAVVDVTCRADDEAHRPSQAGAAIWADPGGPDPATRRRGGR